jgi:tetratricopeptide (TPR) repeat protein
MLRVFALLVTVQLVARPVVLGEDPGLLSDFSDTTSMALTLLWVVLAVGWAVWQLVASRANSAAAGQTDKPTAPARGQSSVGGHITAERPHGPIAGAPRLWSSDGLGRGVEVALLLVVVAMFVSAEWAAKNRFPARLIAWEWFGMFLAFFVVRRVAVAPVVQQRLLTVLLASAVAASVHGIYQATVELPRLRAQYSDQEKVRAELAKEHMMTSPDDPFLQAMLRRIQDNHISGTYAHPNSYAGYLALLLPALVGAAYLAYRKEGWAFAFGAEVCALLGVAALWLTHSRGALLAVAGVAVGLILASRTCRRWMWRHWLGALVAVLVLVAAGAGSWMAGLWSKGIGKEDGTVELRMLYWRTTWRIIQQQPWLAVGPGNFGNAYARNMEDNAAEKIKDPHNFALELWSSAGVFALAAGLAAFGTFFVRMLRSIGGATAADGEAGPQESYRLEYYSGAILGLLLGFILRVQGAGASAIVADAMGAGVRAIAWFAAYGLLEHLNWSARGRAIALTTGVAALLLNLFVSGGIGFPAVAVILWAVAALALNALPPVPKVPSERALSIPHHRPLTAIAPVPVLAAAGLVYIVFVYYPVTTSAGLVDHAQMNGDKYHKALLDRRGPIFASPTKYLDRNVIRLLDDAQKLTPDDARVYLLLASWHAELRRLDRLSARLLNKAPQEKSKADEAIDRAIQLNPEGPEVYFAELRLRTVFAQEFQQRSVRPDPREAEEYRKLAREQYRLAASAMRSCLTYDPTDLEARYYRADALFRGGKREAAAAQASEALEYDLHLTRPSRRLSGWQKWELIPQVPELFASQFVLSAAPGTATLIGGSGSALTLALVARRR